MPCLWTCPCRFARQLVELLTGRTDWSSGCWCRGVVDFAICFVEGLALGLEFGPGRISGWPDSLVRWGSGFESMIRPRKLVRNERIHKPRCLRQEVTAVGTAIFAFLAQERQPYQSSADGQAARRRRPHLFTAATI